MKKPWISRGGANGGMFPLGMTIDPIQDYRVVTLLKDASLLGAVEFEASRGRAMRELRWSGLAAHRHWVRNTVNFFATNRWVSSIEPFPLDTYEIFSRAAEPNSTPLGASVANGFATGGEVNGNRDLAEIHGFGDDREDHSAQFRSTIQRRWDYWERLMNDFEITP